MLRLGTAILLLILTGCAAGPTPERVGFNYPEAGLRFRPRRHVVSRTVVGDIAQAAGKTYTLLFPRTTSEIESPERRLLTTGIVGEWDDNRCPLYDEISVNLFGADQRYSFELTEERQIEVPWPGLESGSGTLRVFRMTPLEGATGTPQYTFAVTVRHYGNAIEFCWREARDVAPDEQKIEGLFYWTKGLRFYEPTGKVRD